MNECIECLGEVKITFNNIIKWENVKDRNKWGQFNGEGLVNFIKIRVQG